MQILTDSKPCVQAYQRLCQGQFSASAQFSTFLSTLSSYNVSVQNSTGKDNVSSDFNYRNPLECSDNACQICKFVNEIMTSVVVNVISVKDGLDGKAKMPFLGINAWKAAQHDCPDLRRTYAHLKHGTTPSRKARILTALHILLKHPTKHQLKLLFERYFYGIKSDQVINQVCEKCVPQEVFTYSSTPSPSCSGEMFFADVMRHRRQKMCVVRDVHSSYTCASIILLSMMRL